MRRWLAVLALVGCARDPEGAACSTCDAAVDAATEPDTPAGDVWGDAALPDPCPASTGDLASENLRSIRRFGIERAIAVVTGTLGAALDLQGSPYAVLTTEEVHRGWAFLTGVSALVPLPKGLAVTAGSRWVVGLSQSYPVPWDRPQPYWGNVTALVPEAEADAVMDVAGYRLGDPFPPIPGEPEVVAPQVAVVRIVGADEYRTRFEVVRELRGELPDTFQDNWYADWELPFPGPGEDEWIVTVRGVSPLPEGGELGSVVDFRPRAELAAVEAVLATETESPREALRAWRETVQTAYRFNKAAYVLETSVKGLAEECCTAMGGTYVAQAVLDVLRGEAVPELVHTGGHAHFTTDRCGDLWLLGLDALPPDPVMIGPFSCPPLRGGAVPPPETESGLPVRKPATHRALVEGWLAARPPVLQLHPLEGDVPPESGAGTTWHEPLDAAGAMAVASHHILIEVDEVRTDALGRDEVVLGTTWYRAELDHLSRQQVRVVSECADPRLLGKGSRWIAPLLALTPISYSPDQPVDPTRAFLLPGTLLPEWAVTDQLLQELALYLNTP